LNEEEDRQCAKVWSVVAVVPLPKLVPAGRPCCGIYVAYENRECFVCRGGYVLL